MLAARGHQVSDRTIESPAGVSGRPRAIQALAPGTPTPTALLVLSTAHQDNRCLSSSAPIFPSRLVWPLVVDPVGRFPTKPCHIEGLVENRSSTGVGNPAWEQIGDGDIQTTLANWPGGRTATGREASAALKLLGTTRVEAEPGGGDRYGAGIVSRRRNTRPRGRLGRIRPRRSTSAVTDGLRWPSAAPASRTRWPWPMRWGAFGCSGPRLAAGTQAAIIHGMAQPPSLLTTDNGLPFGACTTPVSPESSVPLLGRTPAASSKWGTVGISTVARSSMSERVVRRQGKVPWTAHSQGSGVTPRPKVGRNGDLVDAAFLS